MKGNNTHDIFINTIYSLLILYCSACVYYGFFFVNKVNDGFTYSLLLCVTCITALTLYSLKSLIKKTSFSITSSKAIIGFSLCTIVAGIFYLTRESDYSYSIWLDEYVQFIYSNMLKEGQNISAFAAAEQQPAIGYYSMTLPYLLFGFSHFAVKFAPLLFSTAFYLVTPWMYHKITKSKYITFVIYLFSLFHVIFIFYSVEARSYSQAITFCTFSLFYTYQYLKQSSWKNGVLLLSSQFFLVNSIGFQPEVFLIFLAVCLVPLYFKASKKLFLKYISINIFTMVLFFPTMYHIYISSLVSDKFSSKLLQTLNNEIKRYSWADYLSFYHDTKYLSSITFLLAISVIAKFFYTMIKRKTLEVHFLFTLALSIFYILFPICFTLIYKTIINWHFSPRYYLVFYVTSLFTLLFLLDDLKKSLPQKAFKVTLMIIIGFCIYLPATNFDTNFNQIYSRSYRVDWKNVYNKLNQEARPKDAIFHFTLNDIGDWRPDIFVSKEIYAKKELQNIFIPNKNVNLTDSQSQLANYLDRKDQTIFLLINTSRNNKIMNNYLLKPSSHFKLTKVKNMYLLSFNHTEAQSIKKFLSDIINRFGDHSWTYLSYEVLIEYNIAKEEFQRARDLINRFKRIKLDNNKKTIEGSIQNKERIRSQLINYYEKKLKKAQVKNNKGTQDVI